MVSVCVCWSGGKWGKFGNMIHLATYAKLRNLRSTNYVVDDVKLCTLFTVFIALGILLCYIMGRNLVWNWLALAAALFLFPFTFGLYFIPESPPWLIYNDEEDLAFKAWSLFKRKIIHCFSNFLTVRQPFKRKSICRRNF